MMPYIQSNVIGGNRAFVDLCVGDTFQFPGNPSTMNVKTAV